MNRNWIKHWMGKFFSFSKNFFMSSRVSDNKYLGKYFPSLGNTILMEFLFADSTNHEDLTLKRLGFPTGKTASMEALTSVLCLPTACITSRISMEAATAILTLIWFMEVWPTRWTTKLSIHHRPASKNHARSFYGWPEDQFKRRTTIRKKKSMFFPAFYLLTHLVMGCLYSQYIWASNFGLCKKDCKVWIWQM